MMKHYGICFNLLTWLFCIALVTQSHAEGTNRCQETGPVLDQVSILADLDRKLADSKGLSKEQLFELQTCRVEALIATGQFAVATTELTSLHSAATDQTHQAVMLHLLSARLLVAKEEFLEAAAELSSAINTASDESLFEDVIITTGQLAASELPHSAKNAEILLSHLREVSVAQRLTPATAVSLQRLFAKIAASTGNASQVMTHVDAAKQIIASQPAEFEGEIFIALGDVVSAAGLDNANQWYQQALDAGIKADDSLLRSLAEGRLGRSLEAREKLPEALELTRAALFHAQVVQESMLIFKWQWQLSRILQGLGQFESALSMNQAAVETLQRIRPRVMAEGPDAFRTTIRPVYLDLADLLLTRALASSPAEKDILLQKVVETIELLRTDELKDYLKAPCFPVNDASLFDQQHDEPGTAIIYLIDFHDRIEMIVKRGSLLVHRQALAPTRQIKAESYLLEKSMSSIEGRYRESATRLYRWLVEPLEDVVKESKVLVFVPDGSTRTIPFAALLDSSGHHLVEKRAVVMNQGLSVTVSSDPQEYRQRRFFLGGISNAVNDFRAIPSVEEELATIEEMYQSDTLHNQQFTVEQIKEETQNQNHPVVHLASHGQFTGDVDKSFILTWDGELNIQDLSRMVSAGVPRGQTVDLITLSACSTAVGDERAALGLAGVVLKAGARSAIASLWNVDDEATGKFFVRFYETLKQSRSLSKAEAVRKVQLEFLHGEITADSANTDGTVVSTKDFSHPFFWAPFILTGNWH